MNIGFDHEVFLEASFGGIARYYVEMATAAVRAGIFRPTVFAPYYASRILRAAGSEIVIRGRFCGHIPSRGRSVVSWLMRFWTMRSMGKSDIDLVHGTWYNEYSRVGKPTVITVHDLIAEELADTRDRHSRQFLRRRKIALTHAAGIVCPSSTTAEALKRFYPWVRVPVAVIPHGCSQFVPGGNQRPRARPYVLYVGKRRGYKDFATLRDAWGRVSPKFPDLDLICVGGGGLVAEDLHGLSADAARKVIHFDVADSELSFLYRNATAFICTSIFEGFGLPVVEAMAAGAAVICAKASCLPEIAGAAAIYYEPMDPLALEEAIMRIIMEPQIAKNTRSEGTLRAKMYDWSQSAKMHFRLYGSVMERWGEAIAKGDQGPSILNRS